MQLTKRNKKDLTDLVRQFFVRRGIDVGGQIVDICLSVRPSPVKVKIKAINPEILARKPWELWKEDCGHDLVSGTRIENVLSWKYEVYPTVYELIRLGEIELRKHRNMGKKSIKKVKDWLAGYGAITKPENHTWESFCNLLLNTMPEKTRKHYTERFVKFIAGWKRRGYTKIPDEAPHELEVSAWVPSWKRMCKVLLRNDYWCKGLGQSQPKSEAYAKFKALKKLRQEKQS